MIAKVLNKFKELILLSFLNNFKTVRLRRILVIFAFLISIVIINGCTVQKKRGEVGTIGKIYHNTTSLYNGYFNADVLMQEAEVTLESQHQDNYNKLLPLYPHMAANKS